MGSILVVYLRNSKSNTVSVDTANMAHADTVKKIMAIKESNPGNIAIASFDEAHFNGLNDADKAALLKIMASGIGNPGSEMGCYAMNPTDYDNFYEFFKKASSKYHKVDLDAKKHQNDWELKGKEGLPADGVLDLRLRHQGATLHANPNRPKLEGLPIGWRHEPGGPSRHGEGHAASLREARCQPRVRRPILLVDPRPPKLHQRRGVPGPRQGPHHVQGHVRRLLPRRCRHRLPLATRPRLLRQRRQGLHHLGW